MNRVLVASMFACMATICSPQCAVGQQLPTPQLHPPTITWTADWSVSRHRPGFPLLEDVAHFVVQQPSLEIGAYQHHPQISIFNGHFFAAWSAHPSGEDGPGQRVLFSHSTDGMQWARSIELFPPQDEVRVSTERGRVLTALCFVEADEKLFAVAEVHENTGFTTTGESVTATPRSERHSDEFPQRTRKGLGRLIREVTDFKRPGSIFWLNIGSAALPKGPGDYPVATTDRLPEVDLIRSKLSSTLGAPTWDFKNNTTELSASDGAMLVEPSTWQTENGDFVRLWRAQNKDFRMYGQFSSDGLKWSAPIKTAIPDAPAKSVTCRLPSGEVLLIGNQVFNKRGTRRDPLTIAIANNGYDFDRAYAIRWRTPRFRIPSQQAADGRGTGFQYPSVAIDGDHLWVIYSVNKESIEISRIEIQSMLGFKPCAFDSVDCIDQVIQNSPQQHRNIQFDEDAVLKGVVAEPSADGSWRLKMAWQLRPGRRPIRFLHICDRDGKLLRQGDLNSGVFESAVGNELVLDNVLIKAAELEDAAFVAAGFYGPERKSSPITRSDGAKVYRWKVLQLDPGNCLLKTFPVKAAQGVAVDHDYFYAISNTRIVKCDKESGKEIATWEADTGQDAFAHVQHLNSGTVIDGKLYCAHSRYPVDPNDNTIEIWNVQGEELKHERTIPMPRQHGSFTWIDRDREGSWWMCFAVYGAEENRNTKLVKCQYQEEGEEFVEQSNWTFPPQAIETWEQMSCSGGSWRSDGLLYTTGHDHPLTHVLEIDSQNRLNYVRTETNVGFFGQAIAWDRFSKLRKLWGVSKQRDVTVTLIR